MEMKQQILYLIYPVDSQEAKSTDNVRLDSNRQRRAFAPLSCKQDPTPG